MLSGLLKSVSANKGYPLPISLFEMGDIIIKDSTTDTGATNKRMLAAIHCNTVAEFEVCPPITVFTLLMALTDHSRSC